MNKAILLQRIKDELHCIRHDDRQEIQVWLRSEEFTKGFNRALDMAMERCGKIIMQESFSAGVARQNAEESNLDDPHFHGETYEKKIDQKALSKDLFKVFGYLVERPNTYVTDVEIAEATGAYLPSVPRFRCYLASKQYGSHTMLRRRRVGARLHEHSMIVNKDSLTYKAWLQSHSVF